MFTASRRVRRWLTKISELGPAHCAFLFTVLDAPFAAAHPGDNDVYSCGRIAVVQQLQVQFDGVALNKFPGDLPGQFGYVIHGEFLRGIAPRLLAR